MSFLNGPIIIKFGFYEPNRRFIFKLIVGNCWIFQIYVILGKMYLLMGLRWMDLRNDIYYTACTYVHIAILYFIEDNRLEFSILQYQYIFRHFLRGTCCFHKKIKPTIFHRPFQLRLAVTRKLTKSSYNIIATKRYCR